MCADFYPGLYSVLQHTINKVNVFLPCFIVCMETEVATGKLSNIQLYFCAGRMRPETLDIYFPRCNFCTKRETIIIKIYVRGFLPRFIFCFTTYYQQGKCFFTLFYYMYGNRSGNGEIIKYPVIFLRWAYAPRNTGYIFSAMQLLY